MNERDRDPGRPMDEDEAGHVRVIEAPRGGTNVFVHLGVPYVTRDGRTLHLQIIQPSGDAAMVGWDEAFAGRYPCLVFVQGSGWGPQALGAGLWPLCRLAERGYVVAVVEYRPSSVAPHPAQVHDAKAAVRWLRRRADRYGIDPDRLSIAGDSSGGQVALLLHATDGTAELDDRPDAPPLALRSAVAFYPPTDLTTMEQDDAVRDMLGGRPSEVPDVARDASPASHLDARPRGPVLLVHGTADDVVPHAHSLDYARELRRHGQRVQVVLVEGAGHGIWPSTFGPEVIDAVEEHLRSS
ncbi:alpha/beta hydrolase [Salana multivorans]|uniref:alpha/beta hydrolase n=1 Tax=Salana multivorans TaxID=120377 RepID=UPI00248FC072|nr:alpha/beta hydrolase [Salana multivorans]